MSVRNKYAVSETREQLSFFPDRPLVKKYFWLLSYTVLAIIGVCIFYTQLSEGIRVLAWIFLTYFFLMSMYILVYRCNICIIFDKQQKIILRKTRFFRPRKLMHFNEAVIIVKSNTGSIHYALGAKKTELAKNYRISEDFSTLSTESKAHQLYKAEILNAVVNLIGQQNP
ncbi:hypothetical protein [uncultured Chryseobacterium sp.]|uniref:hypothetical protein n=1 Tax=uncultured Chryseobacterium sp. TaxID=259322 RepID=UPI0025E3164A|nr:hypothetical protein [uncultured Chryseobacterium sp.]